MFEQADHELDPAKRQAMLTFSVAGGGFAGVELIGGLNDFARGIAAAYPNIDPGEIRLVLVHSGETILPELSVELGQYAQQKLSERGVEFNMTTRVTGAEPGKVWLGDTFIATETFIWTAGNRPSPIVEMLGIPLTKRGQIEVDKHLAAPNHPGVWALGDCAQIPDPHSRTGFSPPTAQHALREGKIVAHNVAATLHNQPLKEWNFKTLGSLSALGHQLAVAEVFGYRFSGFLAWLMWRGIYLSKLPSFEKQVRVGLDWLLDVFFPPDIVQSK
jgi:NADH:ubiquinone reductase (H+-translocating)